LLRLVVCFVPLPFCFECAWRHPADYEQSTDSMHGIGNHLVYAFFILPR